MVGKIQRGTKRTGIPLRPVTEIAPRFRSVFPYINFNHVQSLVFDTVMNTDKPLVVSAPTGSGKTGVFELAIIKMILKTEREIIHQAAPKVIYLAPTKALCAERRDDWDRKFKGFNIQVLELTSDILSPVNFRDQRKTSILVATPEKWDSITRSWSGNKTFIQSIRLLLIDEIHLVSDGARGATLEAVISRMKTFRSMIWPQHQDNLRFIAASATVLNVQDIADWFATPQSGAQVFRVDPSDRPVKLRTIILGYNHNRSNNEYSFDGTLNHKLADVVKDYSNNKPTLIFCATRKSAQSAATTLSKEGKFDQSFSYEKRQLYLKLASQMKDKTLQETMRMGIAYHHAGLHMNDRKLIEAGFLDGRIFILCCTSTLAIGVNLPAHLVIIKNTSYVDEGTFKPYTETSLVQMIGRAGRPQFDTEATAVIMTKISCRDSIEKMLTGKHIVDSQLHKFLTEHVNSEICLGTINDDAIARKWMDSTYLHVRLRKNPENYGLEKTSKPSDIESTMIKWCQDSINLLLTNSLIDRDKQNLLLPTDAGRAMARNYVCLETAIRLMNLKGTESLIELIHAIASCNEIVNDIKIRNEDRATFNNLLATNEEQAGKLRYAIGDTVNSREKKAVVLIQAVFGNIAITDSSLAHESMRMMKNAERVMRFLRETCLVNTKINYTLLHNVLILSQCFAAHLWEDSIYVSRQLDKIGPILSQNLANNNLTTFEALRNANPRNIEIFCNRLPPFGSNVQQTCFGLPVYKLEIIFRKIPGIMNKIQVMVEVVMENGQDVRLRASLEKSHGCTLIAGCPSLDKVYLRQQVADFILLNRPDLTVCYGVDIDSIDLPADGGEVVAHIISESYVGLNASVKVKYAEPDDCPF